MGGVEKDAKISVGVEGLEDVIKAAQQSKDAWTRAAGDIAGGVQSAGKAIQSSFNSIVDTAVKAATAIAVFDFTKEIAGARRFREETSRLAIASGQDLGALGDRFHAVGVRILATPDAVGAFSKSLGRATYDIKGATSATVGLGLEALNTGKSLEEMQPLGAVLHNSLGVVGDTTHALGEMRGVLEAIGSDRPLLALHDELVALGPLIDQMGIKTEAGRRGLEALGGSITGISEANRLRVKGTLLQSVISDPRGYERLLGEKHGAFTDKHGHVKDGMMPQILERTRDRIMRMAGGDEQLARYIAGNTLGREAGNELFNIDFKKERTAAGAEAKAIPEAAKNLAAFKALQTQLAADAQKRKAAEALLPYLDKAQKFVGEHMGLALVGGAVANPLLQWAGGKALSGGANLLAKGVAPVGSAVLSQAAQAAKVAAWEAAGKSEGWIAKRLAIETAEKLAPNALRTFAKGGAKFIPGIGVAADIMLNEGETGEGGALTSKGEADESYMRYIAERRAHRVSGDQVQQLVAGAGVTLDPKGLSANSDAALENMPDKIASAQDAKMRAQPLAVMLVTAEEFKAQKKDWSDASAWQ